MKAHYILSPEYKNSQNKAEKIYDLFYDVPKTHKEVIDKINKVYEIQQIIL